MQQQRHMQPPRLSPVRSPPTNASSFYSTSERTQSITSGRDAASHPPLTRSSRTHSPPPAANQRAALARSGGHASHPPLARTPSSARFPSPLTTSAASSEPTPGSGMDGWDRQAPNHDLDCLPLMCIIIRSRYSVLPAQHMVEKCPDGWTMDGGGLFLSCRTVPPTPMLVRQSFITEYRVVME